MLCVPVVIEVNKKIGEQDYFQIPSAVVIQTHSSLHDTGCTILKMKDMEKGWSLMPNVI